MGGSIPPTPHMLSWFNRNKSVFSQILCNLRSCHRC